MSMLPQIQILAFIILSPFALVCIVFVMVTFCIYPKTRKLPGDVILAISVCNFIMVLSYFMTALYTISADGSPYTKLCDFIAFMSILANAGDLIYNCAFCMYLYLMLTNVLKLRKQNRIWLHLISLLFTVAVPTISYLAGGTGLDNGGLCFLVEDYFAFYIIISNIIQIVVELLTLRFINKSIPEQQQLLVYKDDFCKYYIKYIYIICIMLFLRLGCVLIVIINKSTSFNMDVLNLFSTCFSILNISEPFVLSIVRLSDPLIRDKVNRLYHYVTRKYVAPELSESVDDNNWLTQLASNLKTSYIVSILQGIRQTTGGNPLNYPQWKPSIHRRQSAIKGNFTDQGLTNEDFNEVREFSLEKSDQTIALKVWYYAPKFFRILQEKDSVMINILESLDPEFNQEQILKFQGPDGGKSGEFFFFSSDHRLILKTIKTEELNTLLERISQYATHVLGGDSMISLIYGIYSFHHEEKQHIILQRNLSQSPSKYILRTYDLKGSELDREVTISDDIDLQKVTLKDLNFQSLEQTIKINCSQQVRDILIRDVEFFKAQGLLDYSLLVLKIDWDLHLYDTNIPISRIQKQFTSPYYMIQSEVEYGVYYHMAIIDYLQEWNAKKYVEEAGKKMIHGNVETSATHPNIYAQRFIDKLILRILQ